MGLTKSVHPYCKLAIITMQMMPKISCPQRAASEAAARDEIACVVLIVTASSLPPRHPFAALSSFQIPPGLPVPRKARHSIELSNARLRHDVRSSRVQFWTLLCAAQHLGVRRAEPFSLARLVTSCPKSSNSPLC